MCNDKHVVRCLSGGVVTGSRKLTIITASIFLVFGSSMVAAAEPLSTSPLDRKSFKPIPFVPSPSETQRHELERAVDLCIKTVEREVRGSHFHASVDRGIVTAVGIDRERFKFWRCMSESGHPLEPIDQ
jgi:hypothetical protein